MEITGTVTKSAVVNATTSGKQVINFTIAVGDGYKAKSGEWVDKTQFIQCAYWRSTSEAIIKMLSKGATVQLFGSLQAPQVWTDRNGNPRASLVFRTANIKPIRKPNQQPQATTTPTATGTTNTEKDDLPF